MVFLGLGGPGSQQHEQKQNVWVVALFFGLAREGQPKKQSNNPNLDPTKHKNKPIGPIGKPVYTFNQDEKEWMLTNYKDRDQNKCREHGLWQWLGLWLCIGIGIGICIGIGIGIAPKHRSSSRRVRCRCFRNG